jgi:hypothetical protein
MPIVEGGCLCGRVRYRVNNKSAVTAVCHCRHCQRQSGSAFSVMLLLKRSDLEINGELETYTDKGDSGLQVLRRFCPRCGSAMMSEAAAAPGRVALKAGTLDDVTGLRPGLHIWCESAQPWVALPDTSPRFPRQPRG